MSVMINIEKECPFCDKESRISVAAKPYHEWQRGLQIQYAFPDMNSFDREVLQSGICHQCQEYIFGTPLPTNEEAWGECIGVCDNCASPIYAKHNSVGDEFRCDICCTNLTLDRHTGILKEEE